ARNMEFFDVRLNNASAETRNDNMRLWIKASFLPSAENKLSFKYTASPKQTMYFINWNEPEEMNISRQVWTQGQGRYTSHWLPSFDDTREKLIFNISYSFKDDYALISNGMLEETIQLKDSLIKWSFSMKDPMSSYLVAVAAGKFEVEKNTTPTGVPV